MALSSAHPQFTALSDRWRLLRDSYEGESKIKAEGVKFLPPTTGMVEHGALRDARSIGYTSYNAY